MNKTLLFWLLLANCFCVQVYGQTVKTIRGTVLDTAGIAQAGVSVNLTYGANSVTSATDAKGNFNFKAVKADSFRITVTSMGFSPFTKMYSVSNGNESFTLSPVILEEKVNAMDAIVIRSAPPVKVKEDTVEFNARAYKVREVSPALGRAFR